MTARCSEEEFFRLGDVDFAAKMGRERFRRE